MMKTHLEDLARQAFSELIRSYRLRLTGVRRDNYGQEITYQNGTTAVRIELDYREGRVFVTLIRVNDGGVPPPRDIEERKRDPLNGFDVDDLIALRDPSNSVTQPGKSMGRSELLHVLTRYGAFLECFAGDVFEGDFTVFRDLAAVVAQRIEQFTREGCSAGPETESFLSAFRQLGAS